MNLYKIKYVIIMKVGYHSDETFGYIIKRKKQEDKCGSFFWGYGGVICHPINQVQPFAEKAQTDGEKLYLLMTVTPSKFVKAPVLSTIYSSNKIKWYNIPKHACITGSKFAIVCKNLQAVDYEIDLKDYLVGIGKKSGIRVVNYLRQRVDKVCAVYSPFSDRYEISSKICHLQYIAEVIYPYAVFLK